VQLSCSYAALAANANTTAWYNASQHLHRQPHYNFVHKWLQSSLFTGEGDTTINRGLQLKSVDGETVITINRVTFGTQNMKQLSSAMAQPKDQQQQLTSGEEDRCIT